MIDVDGTSIIQGVNFLVTLVVLNFLLIRPIREVIKKRNEVMANQADEVAKFTEAASTKVEDYKAALSEARKEATGIRGGFQEEGVAKEQEIKSAASAEASETLKAAQAEVEAEASTAREQLSGQVAAFATKATGKILGQA